MITKKLENALAIREQRPRFLEERLKAYHIWGTIGVDFFLTRQGVCLKCVDENIDTAVELQDETEINAALTASLSNIPELSEILPQRPRAAVVCPQCHDVGRRGVYIICSTCKSLGWIVGTW